jgi:hypothetical protein
MYAMPTFLPRIGLSYIPAIVLLLPFYLWGCAIEEGFENLVYGLTQRMGLSYDTKRDVIHVRLG